MHFELIQLVALGAGVGVLAVTLAFTAATGAFAGHRSEPLSATGPHSLARPAGRTARSDQQGRDGDHTRAQRRRLAMLAALATFFMLLIGAVLGLPGSVVDVRSADSPEIIADELVTSKTYTVRPGDTVWSIAGKLAGDADPRPVVDEIIARNALPRSPLEPGTVLDLP